MQKLTKKLSLVIVALFTVFTFVSYMPAKAATVVPKVQFVGEQKLEYTAGERIIFNLNAANYGGRVQYRVVLWNDATKSYSDLWNTADRYYTNWMPYGNETLPLGWVINEPGSYRITVYTKRAGLANSKTALAGSNCDSYVAGPAFVVKPAAVTPVAVTSVAPVADITVDELATPVLPTEVTLNLADATTKVAKVVWAAVDTTKVGTFPIEGTVEGTELKATVNVIVKAVPLAVKSVSAMNLVQTKVVFNKAVDQDTAETEANYTLTNASSEANIVISNANLLEDGKTVVLTHANVGQQTEAVLDVEDVEDEAEKAIEDYTSDEIEYLDMTIPTVVSAKVVGNDTIKVIFSEPMTTATLTDKDFYEVNDGDLYIDSVVAANNNTEANIVLFSALEEGKITVNVSNDVEDEAGFGVVPKELEVTVVEDEEAPYVVGYKDATENKVTLIFNEEIEIASTTLADYYHTNSGNLVDDAGAGVADISLDTTGKELTLNFTTDNLPEGTGYVYVLKDAVNDLWDNENDQLMIKVEVKEDTTAPTLDDLTVVAEDEITLTFSENLDASTAQDEDNYTLLDSEGEVVDVIRRATLTAADEVTLTFTESLSGVYSLVIENVEDSAENEIVKATEKVEVDDLTVPVATDWSATLYNEDDAKQMVKIDFAEKMANEGKYSVLDLEKYTIDGHALDSLDAKASIKLVDEGTAVEITIPSAVDDTDGVDLNATTVQIARVADAAGNYTANYANAVTLDLESNITITDVDATGTKTIVVTFSDRLSTFNANDVVVTTDNATLAGANTSKLDLAKRVLSVNSSGNSVLTLTLVTALDEIAENNNTTVYVYVVAENSKNVYGETLNATDNMDVDDEIAPTLFSDGSATTTLDYFHDNGNNTFDIQFSEAVYAASDVLAANDFVVKADGDVLVSGVDYKINTIADTVGAASDTIVFELLGSYLGFDGEITIDLATSVNFVKDINGNTLANVSTDDMEVAMAPTVIDATEDTTTQVTIEFSEAIDASTVILANFAGSAAISSVEYDSANNAVVVTLGTALAGTETIIVGAGVTDVDGNAITVATLTRGTNF